MQLLMANGHECLKKMVLINEINYGLLVFDVKIHGFFNIKYLISDENDSNCLGNLQIKIVEFDFVLQY